MLKPSAATFLETARNRRYADTNCAARSTPIARMAIAPCAR
jgi:hypothetical protein